MRKKCLDKWLKALTSGTYKQGRGALRSDKGYCAMGVLCEISKIDEWKPEPKSTKFRYLNQINYLPKEVSEWAGMTQDEVGNLTAFLIVFNDSEKTNFNDLAKMLVEKYKPK